MTAVVRQVGVYQVFSSEVDVVISASETLTIDTNENIDTAVELFTSLDCETANTGNVAYDLSLYTHANQLIENITGNTSATAGSAATILKLPFTVVDAVKYAKKITGTFTFPAAASYSAKLMLGGVPLN